ncbi:MAG: RsmG family class I SAM-dependent methyltransferase [Acidimicrobiales bacterium]|jgi:16S rRNA (guanine527-N7)-methyltransferase
MNRSQLEDLERVLGEARSRSLTGNLPFDAQRAHSEGFLRALRLETIDGPVLELGSGGGLPGLVLALEDRSLRLVLLDSARRSTEYLSWAIAELNLSSRVEVVHMRAEQFGRQDRFRGAFAAVVARSFGLPAVTAECAAPFLKVGGRLIVSEPPPDDSDTARETSLLARRWPVEGCKTLGLAPEFSLRDEFGYAVLRQVFPCPDRYPRRPGIPGKRPLFAETPQSRATSR